MQSSHLKKEPLFKSGINVSMEELIALRTQVVYDEKQIKLPSANLFVGEHLVNMPGRGIEFDSTREYQKGDDVRHMAWRLTARSLKPYVKVYHEEHERPIWLAVDLSPSLYFGTRCCFKSVAIIKKAAALGWSFLQHRERIGAVIATSKEILMYAPKMREQHFVWVLKALSQSSMHAPAFTEMNCLSTLLNKLEQHVRPNNLLYIFSDFFQFDEINQKRLIHLSARTKLKLFFVYDVFEAEPPLPYRYMLSDGVTSSLLNMENASLRQGYRQQFQEKLQQLIHFSYQHHIALEVICTDQNHKVALNA